MVWDGFFDVYLKTNDPGLVVHVWRYARYDEPSAEVIEGEVDEDYAFANTLKQEVMKLARQEAKAYGVRIREPGRMFLGLQR